MRVSLLDGWFPWALRIAAVTLVVLATGWRNRRWRERWLPIAAGTAIAGAVGAWVVVSPALVLTGPIPTEAWIWLAVLLFATLMVIVSWRGGRWWRRGLAVLAVVLTTTTLLNAFNAAIGYYPTLRDAWRTISHAPMPAVIDRSQLGAVPPGTPTGWIVAVAIPDTLSHFRHRQEFVYLPPAWFRQPRPRLPVVELIGGVFAAPDDWIRAGHAVETANTYAQQHAGLAPILVFTDATGDVITDTECVNGTTGNSEDHLAKDIPAFVLSTFDAAPSPRNWGVVGWSMGGTCAVDLVVEHPEIFDHFVDISGDLGPNLGSKRDTISRLFSGNAVAWATHDPLTVLANHGPYHDVTGLFVCGSAEPAHVRHARQLFSAARQAGIPTQLTILPGDHTWKFAAQSFAATLPWLTAQLEGEPR